MWLISCVLCNVSGEQPDPFGTLSVCSCSLHQGKAYAELCTECDLLERDVRRHVASSHMVTTVGVGIRNSSKNQYAVKPALLQCRMVLPQKDVWAMYPTQVGRLTLGMCMRCEDMCS